MQASKHTPYWEDKSLQPYGTDIKSDANNLLWSTHYIGGRSYWVSLLYQWALGMIEFHSMENKFIK